MKFETDTRTRILADMTLDYDPTSTTVEVKVDDDWYPATWQGSATSRTFTKDGRTRTEWKQTAQTIGYFAGPDFVSPGAAVVLTAGRHVTKTRVTAGQDSITHDSTAIDVG